MIPARCSRGESLVVVVVLAIALCPLAADSFVMLVPGSQVQRATSAPSHSETVHAAQSTIVDDDPRGKAYEQQPPHAGCHFRPVHPGTPSNHKGPRKDKRFFEGWYYRITLPAESGNASFAFIYSIEDPFFIGGDEHQRPTKLALSCQQIMGPEDDYLVQADPDPTKLWAWYHQQGLGCVFEYIHPEFVVDLATTTAIDPDLFHSRVRSGFQMFPTRLQGTLIGHDGSKGGALMGQGEPGECRYDMIISPIAGWGDDELGQKSTAGWLASYEVFEPHWQVTMADGRATGSVTWKGKTYEFEDAPFYAEKNWGGAFPIKWYWCQCNSFDGYTGTRLGEPTLSVTAGGGTRKIPLGRSESLGMVSVHYNGKFYEATPWLGTMEWNVSPWGYWRMTGRSTKGERPFEVELEAICESAGVKLRAPTEKEGMVYFCRDSFQGQVTLSMWELRWDATAQSYVRGSILVDRATSTQAAVEVGGGPWWDNWNAVSLMKQPMRGMVRFPYRVANVRKRIVSKVQWVKSNVLLKRRQNPPG